MDQDFMIKATQSNIAEIDAGGLAAIKGNTAGVKTFGAMMVADHSKALIDLKALADTMKVSLPTAADSMHILLKQQLTTLSGKSFDSVYIRSQVADHQNAINLFEAEANSGFDVRLKNYANKYLPALRMHKHIIDSLRVANP